MERSAAKERPDSQHAWPRKKRSAAIDYFEVDFKGVQSALVVHMYMMKHHLNNNFLLMIVKNWLHSVTMIKAGTNVQPVLGNDYQHTTSPFSSTSTSMFLEMYRQI